MLLVEDEAVIRLMIADMLTEFGHRLVAEAGSLQDAVALARTTNCDLALLDVNLVGQTTEPVAEILLERCKPFILIIGYNSEGLPSSLGKALVLQKPFPMAKLKDAIEIIRSDRMPRLDGAEAPWSFGVPNPSRSRTRNFASYSPRLLWPQNVIFDAYIQMLQPEVWMLL